MHLVFQSTIIFQIFHHGLFQIMSFPPGMPMPMMPGPPGMPMPMMPGPPGMQMQMPGPMPMGMPQQKLPMVVMPYYSNKKRSRRHKKRRPKKSSESDCSDSDIDTSSEVEFRARHKGRGRKRQVLTPVVSYVTKDGYVVYQKKIKKEKAKDWLRMGNDKSMEVVDDGEEYTGDRHKRFLRNHRH